MATEKVLGFRIEVKGTEQETSQLAKLGASIDQLKARLKLLNDIQRRGTTLTAKQQKERALLTTQLKANRAEYNQLNRSILQNNGVVQKQSSFTKKLSKSLLSAGAAMIGFTALIGIATRVIGGAIKTAIEYGKANSQLEAILKATNEEMEDLGKQSKELGSTTAFTATQVTELQIEFAKLGFPTEDIINMTKATLDGAAALGSGLGEQAALTGALLKQFGLDSTEAARVNDVLAASASQSALDFSKLSTALPIVGATAETAGVSLERTTALLGTLSNRGLDASTSGTALRNVFLELSKQGLTFEQAMAKINSSTDKNATAMELFGKRGATVGVILSGTGSSVDELTESLEDSEGAARLMAQTMLDNVAGDITIAQSAWEGFILSLEDGEGIISGLSRAFIQTGSTYLNIITEMNNNNPDAIAAIWAKSIGVISDEVLELETATGKLVISQEDLFKAAQNNLPMFEALNRQFQAGTIDADKFQKGVEALAGGWKQLTEEQQKNLDLERERTKAEDIQKEEEAKLQAEIAAGLEADKLREERAKKAEKEAERAAKKALEVERKLAEDKEKARREGEQKALDALLELNRIHFEDERAEELNQIAIKFEDKIAKITGDSEAETQLRLQLEQAKRDAIAEQQLLFDEEDAEAALEERALALENELLLAEEDLGRQREILEQQRALELENENLTEEERNNINIFFDKERKKRTDEEIEQRRAANQALIGAAGDLAGSLSSLAKEGSKEQADFAVAAAAINGAQAVMQILAAQYTGIGFVDAALKAVAIVGVVAKTRSQIQSINSNRMEDGGLVSGPSHDQGGVQMYHTSGAHLGEMEGSEYIISAKRTREIGVSALDAMNFGSSSPATNGFFQAGGAVPNVTSSRLAQETQDRQANMEDLAALVTQNTEQTILNTRIENVATETADVAAEVIQTETELNFG